MGKAAIDQGYDRPDIDLHKAAYDGDFQLVREALAQGVPIDAAHGFSGLTAIQIAVGMDRVSVARYLLQQGAKCTSDIEGRMPSIIAAECMVSREMCDLIVDAEAAALAAEPD